MKITEQICVECGKLLDSGTTWTEANKCPGCGAEIAQYNKANTYRFMSTANAKNEHETALLFARQHKAQFAGKADIGYWIVGPAEARV